MNRGCVKKICLGIALSFVAIFGFGQDTVQTYPGEFNSISIFGKLDVQLIPDGLEKVEVVGEEDSGVSVAFEDRELTVKTLKFFNDDGDVLVKVHFKEVSEINIDGGASVYSNEILDANNLKLKVNTGAYFEAEMAGNNLDLQVGQGAVADLTGSVTELEANVNTGGEFNGEAFTVHEAELKASTGGRIIIKRATELKAKATTGGVIEYLTDPKNIKVKRNTGGQIMKQEDVQ